MRRILFLLSMFLVMSLLLVPSLAAGPPPVFPDIISLPDGYAPEGIVVGHGTNFYVGSLSTGAVLRGNLRTGQ
jgi:hypothetical protein